MGGIEDSVLLPENLGHGKPVFWPFFSSVFFTNSHDVKLRKYMAKLI